MRAIERDGVPGLEIVAADRGPGIVDPVAAFAGTPRAQGSLGVGLESVRRTVTELDVDVRLGAGTCVRTRTFVGPVRKGREVGIVVRAVRGEPTAGDDVVVVRRDGVLRVAVADGLGHGAVARKDAATTVDALSAPGAVAGQLEALHGALGSRRGSVVGVVEIDEGSGEVTTTGVGNVEVLWVHAQGTRRFAGEPGALGVRGGRRLRLRPEAFRVAPRDLLVLFTDGLTSRTTLDFRDPSARQHPVVVAHRLLTTFGRDHDDATIVVVA